MNYLKEHTVGIDTKIKELQTYLYNELISKGKYYNFDAYGRVYKNKRSNKVIPEYYVGNKEYKEILLDDNLDGIMFFSPSDFSTINGNISIQDCDIIFSVNLSNCNDNRQDEEVRQDVLFLLTQKAKKGELKNVVTGLDNVYSDYNGVADYFYDMQNFHHFKITIELNFTNNKCK